MKKTAAVILSILLAPLLCGGASAQTGGPRLSLIETGAFHGDEITANSGERWLGLFPTAKGFSLLRATLTVLAVHDPVVDANPSVKTGKEVRVRRAGKSVFLLKGAGGPRLGLVKTAFAGEKNLGNAEAVKLRLGKRNYLLKVVSDDPNPSELLMQNSRLILVSGRKSQVLFSAREHDDAGWALLWAGDLDGDGQLDLYVDLSAHYNVSERRLFLSTKASRRRLVREVAEFRTVGC